MADNRGGYRKPSNPAPVSGPGAMSKRTDGKQGARYVSGLPYGEGQDFYDLQTSAPMAGGGTTAQAPQGSGASGNVSPVVPFNAPTQYPNEPVTAGADIGAGPGMSALPPTQTPDQLRTLRAALPILLKFADDPSVSDTTRTAIQYLRGAI
jgi:hypothetical protein